MTPAETKRPLVLGTPADREWFARDALLVAELLIGACIRHGERVARIVETEAYRGPGDRACHARSGVTRRNRPLFGPPGTIYVFQVYGMHRCFNIVCAEEGAGQAVLIRAAEPILGFSAPAKLSGPALFCKAMGFGLEHNGQCMLRDDACIIPPGTNIPVDTGPRVGVAYAAEDAELPYRFLARGSACVSRPPKSAIGLGFR